MCWRYNTRSSIIMERPFLAYTLEKRIELAKQLIQEGQLTLDFIGKRIDTFNIGRKQSEKAKKELELKYDLVRAKGRQLQNELFPVKPLPQKINYGKSELRRSITNILDAVLPYYKFTSLPELNAILKQYNIMADPCREGSRTYKHHGLFYRAIDEKGNKIGVPIKASLIYNKPTHLVISYLSQPFLFQIFNERFGMIGLQSFKTKFQSFIPVVIFVRALYIGPNSFACRFCSLHHLCCVTVVIAIQ
jgi:hypothetical protein